MREDAIRPILDGQEPLGEVRMKRGRRTNTFDAERMGVLVRHLYFQLGRKEREIASDLGITCSTVNYYKNRQKR